MKKIKGTGEFFFEYQLQIIEGNNVSLDKKKYNSYSKQLKEIQTPLWKLKTLFKCKVIIKKKNHIILEYQQEPF